MNQLSVDTPKDYFRMYQKAISDITPEIICKMIQTYVQPNLARISIAGAIGQI
jgi:predicted Zn-dependent peptidase